MVAIDLRFQAGYTASSSSTRVPVSSYETIRSTSDDAVRTIDDCYAHYSASSTSFCSSCRIPSSASKNVKIHRRRLDLRYVDSNHKRRSRIPVDEYGGSIMRRHGTPERRNSGDRGKTRIRKRKRSKNRDENLGTIRKGRNLGSRIMCSLLLTASCGLAASADGTTYLRGRTGFVVEPGAGNQEIEGMLRNYDAETREFEADNAEASPSEAAYPANIKATSSPRDEGRKLMESQKQIEKKTEKNETKSKEKRNLPGKSSKAPNAWQTARKLAEIGEDQLWTALAGTGAVTPADQEITAQRKATDGGTDVKATSSAIALTDSTRLKMGAGFEYTHLLLTFGGTDSHKFSQSVRWWARFIHSTDTPTTHAASGNTALCQDWDVTGSQALSCAQIHGGWCQSGGLFHDKDGTVDSNSNHDFSATTTQLPTAATMSFGSSNLETAKPMTPTLKFLMGDTSVKVCLWRNLASNIAATSRFTTAAGGAWDIWPTFITVYGMYDISTAARGIPNFYRNKQKYYCFILRNQYNNPKNEWNTAANHCQIIYDGQYQGWVGTATTLARGSWGTDFDLDHTSSANTGTFGINHKFCGTENPSTKLSFVDAADGSATYIMPTYSPGNKGRFSMPSAKNDLDGASFKPFTTSVCWCADDEYCSLNAGNMGLNRQNGYFSQMVGVVHYFLSKICRADDTGQSVCENHAGSGYNGVTPRLNFKIRIECPLGACPGTDQKMKVIARDPNAPVDYDKPKGDPLNACSLKTHGRDFNERTIFKSKQIVCDGADCQMKGIVTNTPGYTTIFDFPPYTGSDPDLTIAYEDGFELEAGQRWFESLSFRKAIPLDICFCISSCNGVGSETNWFKVGQLHFASYRLLAESVEGAETANLQSLKYVNEGGSITFESQTHDRMAMGLVDDGIIKILPDSDTPYHNLADPDRDCQLKPYNTTLVEQATGLSSVSAYDNFRGTLQNGTRLAFNGGVSTNDTATTYRIVIKYAGVIQICYCQFSDPITKACKNDKYWVKAARMTIQGPSNNMNWEFSTMTVFRLEYFGYGLTSDNKLRIISGDGKCSDNYRNPDKGSYDFTFLQVKCPDDCTNVGSVTDAVNGDLQTQILSSSTFDCDSQLTTCKRNDIRSIEVVSETETELTFELPPKFEDGVDVLTLGDNIFCKAGDALCTDERLMHLKGVFDYPDKATRHFTGSDNYILGHKVRATSEPNKWRLQVGWKKECHHTHNGKEVCGANEGSYPQFEVVYNLATQTRGQWARRNRALTKLEIKGLRDRQNLRVCWNYGGHVAENFVSEIALLNLVGANPMDDTRVSLTTSLKDTRAPIIISFKTASANTGARYLSTAGPTQIKIVFTDTTTLEVYYSDDVASSIETNPSEDEMSEARQYICGRLFKEMFSDDQVNGFPMPRGCYYKKYGFSRELYILFEPRNGLKPGHNYQLVVHGSVHGAAVAGGKYIEVFTMDDVNINPYMAIERGEASLSTTPENSATSSTSPRWQVPGGFKVLCPDDSCNRIVQLGPGSSLLFELAGDTTYKIREGAIFRVFLWPLTVWNVASSCDVVCTPSDTVLYQCAKPKDCQGIPAVLNSNNNIIRIIMSDTMTHISGSVRHRLEVSGLAIPQPGWFPLRVGAQVTDATDLRPSYVTSEGDLFWKQPDDGTSIAKIITSFGDGNQAPFKGQTGNILYVNFIFASTLFAAAGTGDAGFIVEMPPGYRCEIEGRSQMGLSPSIFNPWEAPTTLNVYKHFQPQGRGAPSTAEVVLDANGNMESSHGWIRDKVLANKCYFRLKQYGYIARGSAMVVKFVVDNPATALPRQNVLNEWRLTLFSKGSFTVRKETKAIIFKATNQANYTSNVAVLGYLSETVIVPSDFLGVFLTNRVVRPYLFVFFKTEQSAGLAGYVLVDAPKEKSPIPTLVTDRIGYKFDTPYCDAGDLPHTYYALRKGSVTKRLPRGIKSCLYEPEPYNRANIQVHGIIEAGIKYGFRIRVTNPYNFDTSQLTGWKIYTMDSTGGLIDGNYDPHFAKDQGTIQMTEGIGGTNYPGLSGTSFGVYGDDLNTDQDIRCTIQVSDMKPYSHRADQFAVLTFEIQGLPQSVLNVKLRIIAPFGFEWSPGPPASNFLYKSVDIAGVTADFPGGAPGQPNPKHVLLFPASNYGFPNGNERYRFKCNIKVPDYAPNGSSGNFTVEFGYDGTTIAQRPYGAVIAAAPVQALTNAFVDYSTNRDGRDNVITLRIETASAMTEAGGGFQIRPPARFSFPLVDCGLANVRPLPEGYRDLPKGTRCDVYDPSSGSRRTDSLSDEGKLEEADHSLVTSGDTGGDAIGVRNPFYGGGKRKLQDACAGALELRIRIVEKPTDGSPALPADRYAFSVLAKNPVCESDKEICIKYQNQDCTQVCQSECWDFASHTEIPLQGTLNIRLSEDAPQSAYSFKVNTRLAESRLFLLDKSHEEYLRVSTGRDDRPLKPNSLIFSFKLQHNAEATSEMILRGPAGFIFADDCLSGFHIRTSIVFGTAGWLPGYEKWPTEVEVTKCRGSMSEARLTIVPAETIYLEAGKLHVFRIDVKSNPAETPTDNYWTLEYSGQSSSRADMPGFPLWTFTHTGIETVSTARDPSTEDKDVPIRVLFRPFKTVSPDLPMPNSGGLVKVVAPKDFEFVQVNGVCKRVIIRAEAFVDANNGLDMQAEVWPSSAVRCKVADYVGDAILDKNRQLLLYLNSDKVIYAGRDHSVLVDVKNAELAPEGVRFHWMMQSFAHEDGSRPLDESTVEGYPLNLVMNRFFFRNEDQNGMQIRNGLTAIPDLFFQFETPVRIDPGHQVVLLAPTGFLLNPPEWMNPNPGNECYDFQWDPDGFDYFGSQSTKACRGNLLVFNIAKSVPKGTPIKFRLDTGNPSATPFVFENFWKIYHYKRQVLRPSQYINPPDPSTLLIDSATGDYQLLASDVYESWDILPQLMNVSISLGTLQVGNQLPNRAATSRSDIKFEFAPVSQASEVKITANYPSGFDFTGSSLVSGQEIKFFDGSTIRIRVNIPLNPTGLVSIHVQNVVLGDVSSGDSITQTVFSITTYYNGVTKDEKLMFDEGFRLPGIITSYRAPRLYSRESMHPHVFPVKSTLPIRVNRTAFADFFIQLSSTAKKGEYLNVTGTPYNLTAVQPPHFMVREYDAENHHVDSMFTDRSVPPIGVTIKPQNGTSLDVQLNDALIGNRRYVVTIEVMTPLISGEKWRFETRDWLDLSVPQCQSQQQPFRFVQCLPTNTNDGTEQGFQLVSNLALTASAPTGAPPLAKVIARLRINPGVSTPNQLRIIAPPNFNFTSGNSLVSTNLDVLECRRAGKYAGSYTGMGSSGAHAKTGTTAASGTAASTTGTQATATGGSSTARGGSSTAPGGSSGTSTAMTTSGSSTAMTTSGTSAAATTSGTGTPGTGSSATEGRNTALCKCRPDGLQGEVVIDLLMLSPTKTPNPTAWFVLGEEATTGALVGWGEDATGFNIDQMAETTVLYTGIPGQMSELTFGFKSAVTLENGGEILILVPKAFEVSCNDLNQISIPGSVVCEAKESQKVRLILSATLAAKRYAFSLKTVIPQTTPVVNTFSVLLYDKSKEVKDAAMNIEGLRILSGMDLRSQPLWWQRAEANKNSDVRISFLVNPSTTSFGDEQKRELGEILINFPLGFQHNVQAYSEVNVKIAGRFVTSKPLVEDSNGGPKWLDYTQPDRLRISLVTSSDVSQPSGLSEIGKYEFGFRVQVPAQMPDYNVWRISLCKGNGGCITSADSSVQLVFPIPGFNLGEISPVISEEAASPAEPKFGNALITLLVGLWFLL